MIETNFEEEQDEDCSSHDDEELDPTTPAGKRAQNKRGPINMAENMDVILVSAISGEYMAAKQ